MAVKRRQPDDHDDDYDANAVSSRRVSAPKRMRLGPRVTLFDFSDEILLRIFTFLPVRQLLCIERRRLAADAEIWRVKYFDRWILTRLSGLRARSRQSLNELLLPNKAIRWLEHGAELKGGAVDWKRLYRIRRNWDQGFARFEEVEVASPPSPPVLAEVCQGLILTADGRCGLRAWSELDHRKHLLHQIALDEGVNPRSLAADATAGTITVAVGSDSGRMDVYRFSSERGFQKLLDFRSPTTSAVMAIALMWPYVLVMSPDKHIYLHLLLQRPQDGPENWSATVLTTLHANAPLQTAALSLRCTPSTIIASISYAFHQLNAGLCLGLQEVRLSKQGDVVGSRLSSTIDTPLEAKYRGDKQWKVSSRATTSSPLYAPFAISPLITSPPNSLSYSHPYLLASLPDNTIMAYLVTSNDDKLEISTGRRLWGHTSAISRAEVTHRGRAVSVSARGGDVRLWELEDALTLPSRGKASTAVRPWCEPLDAASTIAIAARAKGLGLTIRDMKHELALTQQWVGFDNEQVVVMGERDESEGHLSKECTNAAKPKTCYKCGQENHLARDCPDAAPAPGATSAGWGSGAGGYGGGDRECYRCGGRGHIARDCTSSGGSSFSGGFSGGNFGRGNTTTCYVFPP
ncbi:hypothetical protein DV737_g3968, partial [Chaetothyriales sp. CBS 132003]